MTAIQVEIIQKLRGKRLAVVGDCMIDRFLWGTVDRISPEAPVPVVRVEEETVKLGGAANVARNLHSLQAEVALVGVTGDDAPGGYLRAMLEDLGMSAAGIISLKDRPTTEKTRVIASHQQVVRTDIETDAPLPDEQVDRVLARLHDLGPFEAIILSDYAKGLLTDDCLARIIGHGREIGAVVTVDPKHGDYRRYRGVTSMTPNQKEAGRACAIAITDPESLDEVGRTLLDRTEAEAVLITRGEHGMALFESGGESHHLPTEATEVYDVTGAGDTVIATYTAALVAGASFLTAANLANHAAGLAVRELGTAAVTAEALMRSLEAS